MEHKDPTMHWEELDQKMKDSKQEFCSLAHLVIYENGLVMPRFFAESTSKRLRDFKLRDDDIWVLSFPKTGTTLTLEMVWSIVNDVDLTKVRTVPHLVRSPYIESGCVFPPNIKELAESELVAENLADPITFVENMSGRRVIKSHLPLEFLPPDILEKCKVVYVGRNVKDTAVSYYYWLKFLGVYWGDFNSFQNSFKDGVLVYGSYWNNIMSAWNKRNHPNLKFIWYEDLHKNKKAIINDLCDFLQHPLTTEKKIELEEYLQFENMKQNKNATPLAGIKWPTAQEGSAFRKGIIGDWKNHFLE